MYSIGNKVYYYGRTYYILDILPGGLYILEGKDGEKYQIQGGFSKELPQGTPVVCYGVKEIWELWYYDQSLLGSFEWIIPWYDFNPYDIEGSKEFSV